MLNQLASLSALATQTAQSFPEIDDLTDFDGEDGDRTVMQPAGLAPALPPEAKKAAGKEDGKREDTNGHAQAGGRTTTTPTERPQAGNDTPSEPELDGDATIVIPVGAVPSGTAHLKGEGE